jgi:hypothetical protein
VRIEPAVDTSELSSSLPHADTANNDRPHNTAIRVNRDIGILQELEDKNGFGTEVHLRRTTLASRV